MWAWKRLLFFFNFGGAILKTSNFFFSRKLEVNRNFFSPNELQKKSVGRVAKIKKSVLPLFAKTKQSPWRR